MRPRKPETLEPEKVVTLHINDADVARPKPGPGVKVLLLDDRDDFREVLHEYLVSRSYQVTSVWSGIEGLREIMKGGFDLVICDMMMPKMGGEMFYWAVTRVRPAASQHFIFFTGHRNNPRNEFFFQRINATVLYKPFKLSALDSTIRDVFRRLGRHTQPSFVAVEQQASPSTVPMDDLQTRSAG
jgi:DNA-binding response OmpR family regulator